MGERDERIETLKARQEEMKDRLGGVDVEYRDLTNAPQGDSTPEQLDQRAEDIGAITGERTALESELGRTEGELGELEAGAREDARRADATETGLAPSASDNGEIATDLATDSGDPSQGSADAQNLSETVTQEPAQDLTEATKVPREDWEKISTEQDMHQGQMTELRDAGNDVVANMNFASTDIGKDVYRDETGSEMTREAQRGLEQQAYSGGVEQLNNLFAAHDQQRQALYGSNTAENPKVREAQLENRAAMDKEMNGLRYEIVEKEVCALEARKAVDFRNEDAIDHYRDRLTREGRDQATIDAREDAYRVLLSQDKAKDVKDMTTALHRDDFSTVPDHFRVIEPAPATQQPGMARAPEESNTLNTSGGGTPPGPPPGGSGGPGPSSGPGPSGGSGPSAGSGGSGSSGTGGSSGSSAHSVKSSDEHPEWHKVEAENELQQKQIDEMQLAKGKVVSELASKAEEMGTTPTFDQLKDFYATSTKGFQELNNKFEEHDAQTKALHDGNGVDDPKLRAEQMQNRDVLEHSTHLFRYEATRDVAEAVAKKQVELKNDELLRANNDRMEAKGASPQEIENSNNTLKGFQEADRKADQLTQTATVHAQHCPELAANPPVLAPAAQGGGVGGGAMAGPAGGAGGGGGAPAMAAPSQQGPPPPGM